MEKQRVFAWKRLEVGRQPGCSAGLSPRAAGDGALGWHPAGDDLPWGKTSPLGHRVQMLQIAQGWDKGVCKKEIITPYDKEMGSDTFCNYRT